MTTTTTDLTVLQPVIEHLPIALQEALVRRRLEIMPLGPGSDNVKNIEASNFNRLQGRPFVACYFPNPASSDSLGIILYLHGQESNLPVLAHEIGHAIDNLLYIESGWDEGSEEGLPELYTFGLAQRYPDEDDFANPESFAECIRILLGFLDSDDEEISRKSGKPVDEIIKERFPLLHELGTTILS